MGIHGDFIGVQQLAWGEAASFFGFHMIHIDKATIFVGGFHFHGGTQSPDDLSWKIAIGGDDELPSGKRLHSYGKSPYFLWENTLCLWPWLQ